MKLPAIQFYTGDWRKNGKLRRCSEAARGAWMDLICFLHESEEYGVARMPLAELVRAAGVTRKSAKELVEKCVLKGGEEYVKAYVHQTRHAGKAGPLVTLLEASDGPMWYSSRLVRDEWVRQRRGQGTRFSADNQPEKPTRRQGEKPAPSPRRSPSRAEPQRQGDGPSVSVSLSQSNTVPSNEQQTPAAVDNPSGPGIPARILETLPKNLKRAIDKPKGNGAAPHDEPPIDPEQIPEPTPARAPAFRLGDDLDPAWRESPDGIDHAGITLGMARIPFEPDQDYAQRIEQRLALDTRGSP